MKHKSEIIAAVRRITAHHSELHDRQLIHPRRDWTLGLVFGVVVSLVAGAWSAQQFISYRDIEMESVSVESTIVYRATLVADVLGTYETKAKNYAALLSASTPTPQIIPLEIAATSSATSTSPIELPDISESEEANQVTSTTASSSAVMDDAS